MGLCPNHTTLSRSRSLLLFRLKSRRQRTTRKDRSRPRRRPGKRVRQLEDLLQGAQIGGVGKRHRTGKWQMAVVLTLGCESEEMTISPIVWLTSSPIAMAAGALDSSHQRMIAALFFVGLRGHDLGP